MAICISLIFKIIPLYLNIALGYFSGKFLKTSRETIARLMFYLINPIVIFNGILHTKLDASILTLPFLTFTVSSLLCLSFYFLSKQIWSDSSKNIIAFTAGSGNTGYFGLPVAILLFNDQGEGVYMMAMLGLTLYENSLGYYICAKNDMSSLKCFKELIKLPTMYALIGALFINMLQIPIPEVFNDFMGHIKGAYTVLGMMIIGLGLSEIKNFSFDFKFISMAFLAKFIAWPAVVFAIVALDTHYFNVYTLSSYKALILISIVPLAVNTAVVASILNIQPEKASIAVLLSALFALFYVPFMVFWFL